MRSIQEQPIGSAKEALRWMEEKAKAGKNRFLFRGQTAVYKTIKPSMTRIVSRKQGADSDQLQRRYHDLVTKYVGHASGMFGVRHIDEHDSLAILQHYIVKSPVIDLTGLPQIALYFAINHAKQDQECVVYAVDTSKQDKKKTALSDHQLIVRELEDGGTKHRWLRQDGFSVGPVDWRNFSKVKAFNLKALPGVEGRVFRKSPDDQALIQDLGNLENTADDPLAKTMFTQFKMLANACCLSQSEIDEILKNSSLIDPSINLQNQILAAEVKAQELNASDDLLRHIEHLKTASLGIWSTNEDCTWELVCRQINEIEVGKK